VPWGIGSEEVEGLADLETDEVGVGVAVRDARALGPEITGTEPPRDNATPDLVLDRLHRETIAAWKEFLADLRVRPFRSREQAIRVSGALARAENPLTRLLREVWRQAGGEDRGRSHEQQLRLAREFGPTIQYVEAGRMAEIARLFSRLNVALGAADFDEERAAERLMDVADRSRSIQALKAAPTIVVQIAEDVLAQSARAPGEGLAQNPLTRQWQQLVYPACREAVEGRYPFADGPEADMDALARLLGPEGALPSFFARGVQEYLDTAESPWRWKPEARFAGLGPESAAFFERAMLVSEALFDRSGRLRLDLTLAALAERGRTMVAIGGEGAPVRATGEAAKLVWPGPEPAKGVEVSFREGPDAARIRHEGAWGLIRLLDTLRLRLRDEGRRVLLDLRTDEGRVFLRMDMADPVNPVSARAALRGFACPPVL
jgi:type VI protein secretion system component VasK